MSVEKPIRPRPSTGSLADQVRAVGSRELDEQGRKVGALNDAELAAWTTELAEVVKTYPVREVTTPLVVEAATVREAVDAALELGERVRKLEAERDTARDRLEQIEPDHAECIAVRGALEPRFFDGQGAVWGATGEEVAACVTQLVARVVELEDRLEQRTAEVETRRACATEQARRIHDLEQRIVDLIAVELQVVTALRRAGVITTTEPPSTTELATMLVKMNGGGT